jgi:uncharacterized membrane protein YesL
MDVLNGRELMRDSRLSIRVLLKALTLYWDEAFNLMICNLLWALAQILIVLGPPATAALFYVTNQVAHGGFARIGEFWSTLKRDFVTGWKWGLLNLLVVLLMGNAISIYGLGGILPEPWGFLMMFLSVAFLLVWLLTQLFAYPFWLEQSDKRMVVALKNGLIIQAQNMVLMFLFLLLMAVLLTLVYFLPPLALLGVVSLLMVVSNTMVVELVEILRDSEE